jgi:hypothetical protein
MGNESEQQAYDAYVQHLGVEKQEVNNSAASPRKLAKY